MSESQPPAAAWSESSGDIRVSEVDGLPRVAANGGGHSSVDVYDDDSGDVSAPGSMLRAALDLAELGYPVFPVFGVGRAACLCGRPACENQGKHPMVEWREAASASASIIESIWKRSPEANIGLPCGVETRLVVLDVDHDSGRAALAEYERKHGALPDTVRALTGGGNDHYLFEHPGGYIKTTVGRPAMDGQGARGLGFVGLDSRADGGYIVAPSSLHVSGRRYRWYPGRELGAYPLAPLPQWIADLLRPSEPAERSAGNYLPPRLVSIDPYLRAAVERECTNVVRTAKGGRNDQLNVSAFNLGLLVAGGELAGEVVRQSMLSAALSAGLGEREARNTIESALAGARKKDPRRVPALPPRTNGMSRMKQPATVTAPSDDASPSAPVPAITWVGPDRIFASLPPMTWISEGLMIGPGRPTELLAYGGTGKSLSGQQLGLASAAGEPIWGHFAVREPMRVCHLDYEQGARDTYYRYQRLAIGHGISRSVIGDRLHVAAMPSVYLTNDAAYDAYARVGEQHELVLLDSLRASTPGVDENDSTVRSYVDILTRASDATGASFLFIHHTGKSSGHGHGGERDKRELGRGSSAIFDGCGCVLSIELGADAAGPRKVTMTKPPTSGEGGTIAPFGLTISDVAIGGNPRAGVAVTWVALATPDDQAEANAAYDADVARLMTAIVAQPGASTRTVRTRAGMKTKRCTDVLASMVADGLVTLVTSVNRTNTYWPGQPK